MRKSPLFQKINCFLSNAAGYLEILMSVIILVVILVLSFSLLRYFPQGDLLNFHNDSFNEFLSAALTLVVGLEFVKMLCMHTPETVIEVLMFATARQMIVEHLSPLNTLIGVITIALLFAIRKFLLIDRKSTKTAPPECHPDSDETTV
ncbi:MAG: phosphate-starvation-inducible PsiE family protein [Butyricicoccaceae bacterium]